MKDQSATPNSGADRHGKYRRADPTPEVTSITNAAVPHSDDMRQRMIKYSVTMGIRMVCLALIFVFDGWFKIIPVAGAVILPWVAVMIANGGADINHQETVELLDEAPMYALTEGGTDADDDDAPSPDFLTGEVVPDGDDDTDADAAPDPAADQEDKHHEHL